MKPYGHLKILNGTPKKIECWIDKRFATPGLKVGRQIDPHAPRFSCADDFFNGPFRIDKGNMCDRVQPLRIMTAKINNPPVVRLGIRRR